MDLGRETSARGTLVAYVAELYEYGESRATNRDEAKRHEGDAPQSSRLVDLVEKPRREVRLWRTSRSSTSTENRGPRTEMRRNGTKVTRPRAHVSWTL